MDKRLEEKLKKDPLYGLDLEAELKLIKEKKSKRPKRIRSMIEIRVEFDKQLAITNEARKRYYEEKEKQDSLFVAYKTLQANKEN